MERIHKTFFERHVGTIISIALSGALSTGTGLIAYGRGQEKAANIIQQCDAFTKAIIDLQTKQQQFCILDGEVAQHRTEIMTIKERQDRDHDLIIKMEANLQTVADWVRGQQRRELNKQPEEEYKSHE